MNKFLLMLLFIPTATFAQKNKLPQDILEQPIVVSYQLVQSGPVIYTSEEISKELTSMGFNLGHSFEMNEHANEHQSDVDKANEQIEGKEYKYCMKIVTSKIKNIEHATMWTASIVSIQNGIELNSKSDEVFLQQGTSCDNLMKKLKKSVMKLQSGK